MADAAGKPGWPGSRMRTVTSSGDACAAVAIPSQAPTTRPGTNQARRCRRQRTSGLYQRHLTTLLRPWSKWPARGIPITTRIRIGRTEATNLQSTAPLAGCSRSCRSSHLSWWSRWDDPLPVPPGTPNGPRGDRYSSLRDARELRCSLARVSLHVRLNRRFREHEAGRTQLVKPAPIPARRTDRDVETPAERADLTFRARLVSHGA